MDRFTEESTDDLAGGYAVRMKQLWGDDPLFTLAVNVCENCRQTCEHLIRVPEFDYMACERCADEAMEIIARETAIPVLRPIHVKVAKLTAPEFQKEEVA
jgi:hypothetical protein